MKTGQVHSWHDSYGFIRETYKRTHFFHISEFDRSTPPVVGEAVTFEIAEDPKDAGRTLAINVVPANGGGK